MEASHAVAGTYSRKYASDIQWYKIADVEGDRNQKRALFEPWSEMHSIDDCDLIARLQDTGFEFEWRSRCRVAYHLKTNRLMGWVDGNWTESDGKADSYRQLVNRILLDLFQL